MPQKAKRIYRWKIGFMGSERKAIAVSCEECVYSGKVYKDPRAYIDVDTQVYKFPCEYCKAPNIIKR